MNTNKRTTIIGGRFVDLDKTPIEDLKKIQKDLEIREKELKKQIEKKLKKMDN